MNTAFENGQFALRQIADKWKGNGVTAAVAAASDIGMLIPGSIVGWETALGEVTRGFNVRRIDEKWWPTVHEAFQSGRSSMATNADIRKWYFSAAGFDTEPLPVIDPRDWQGKAIPDRQWFVDGLIPHRTVTNLSGAGGSGKTEIVLQMVVASALQTDWFGKTVAVGPCLYYGAEDEADELHRRLATIVQRAGKQLSDLGGIRLVPMAGLDAVLAEPDRLGKILETDLFPKLKAEADALNAKLIVIDPSADVFAGDEINRSQVRKFVSMLRGLALDLDCAVLLLSHPSLTGLNTGTGTSGSTAWSNSVRSRLYMEVPKLNSQPHPLARVLKVVKSNYGATGEEIAMRWDNGIYVLDGGGDPVVETLLNVTIDNLFLELLALFTAQGQNVGIATGTNYAPAKMATHPKAKGYRKAQFVASMQRLLDGDQIKVVTEGAPSRQRSRLAIVESNVH